MIIKKLEEKIAEKKNQILPKFRKSISQIETELSKFDPNTCIYEKYLEYVKTEIKYQDTLSKFYADPIFREYRYYKSTMDNIY